MNETNPKSGSPEDDDGHDVHDCATCDLRGECPGATLDRTQMMARLAAHAQESMPSMRINVGDHALVFDGGGGYGEPFMLDHMTLSIRKIRADGKLGARVSVDHSVQHSDMASLALGFLDMTRRMMPEGAWMRCQSVHERGQIPQAKPATVRSGVEKERAQALADIEPREKNAAFLANAKAYERLRSRAPVLQNMVRLLETCDDATFNNLAMLLMFAEQTGSLPFSMSMQVQPPPGFGLGDGNHPVQDDGPPGRRPGPDKKVH